MKKGNATTGNWSCDDNLWQVWAQLSLFFSIYFFPSFQPLIFMQTGFQWLELGNRVGSTTDHFQLLIIQLRWGLAGLIESKGLKSLVTKSSLSKDLLPLTRKRGNKEPVVDCVFLPKDSRGRRKKKEVFSCVTRPKSTKGRFNRKVGMSRKTSTFKKDCVGIFFHSLGLNPQLLAQCSGEGKESSLYHDTTHVRF